MTIFYGTYDDCRCIAHAPGMAEAYDTIRKFLSERKVSNYRLKTWTSPEKITTVEFGNPRYEFYVIENNEELEEEWILRSNGQKLSMRKYEVE